MQAIDRFEGDFGRRLRAELDSVEVRLPARPVARDQRRLLTGWRIARPLALAMAATLAFAALASAATRSADPREWIKPAQWMGWTAPEPQSPAAAPAVKPSPSESPEPAESPSEPQATASEPAESTPTGSSRESPEPHETGSPPAEGGGDG